jgi:hypothetical protein
MEGCNKEHKKKLEDVLQVCKGEFQECKGLPPKREVEHEIQLSPNSPLPNIGLYRSYILEVDGVNK